MALSEVYGKLRQPVPAKQWLDKAASVQTRPVHGRPFAAPPVMAAALPLRAAPLLRHVLVDSTECSHGIGRDHLPRCGGAHACRTHRSGGPQSRGDNRLSSRSVGIHTQKTRVWRRHEAKAGECSRSMAEAVAKPTVLN